MKEAEKEKIFLNLLENYKNQIYRVAWGFTNNPHDVEDLFQEVILNVWKGLNGFRAEASHSTWIYRIAVNTCILWQKKSPKEQLVDESSLPDVAFESDAPNPVENPNIIALRVAIQQLKKVDRSLMLLLLEGFSYKEIAEITGLTVTNVGAKLSRIKTKLKSLMI